MRRELQRQIDTADAIPAALEWANVMIRRGLPAGPVRLSIGRPSRTTDANRFFWATLRDISRQVEWVGQRLTEEEWKDVLSAAWKRQKVVPGVDGGFVVLGVSTSKLTVKEFSELTELALAFGSERGVKWTAPQK